jgi:hypothetical protein
MNNVKVGIVTLSPKGARENLEFIENAIPHGLKLLMGEVTDCAEETKNNHGKN